MVSKWFEAIFHYGKRVEIRGQPTKKRGRIFVLESGSYFIGGVFELVMCEGPLSEERYEELRSLHKVPGQRFYGAHTYAYHFVEPRRISPPIPCMRKPGQVDWIVYRTFTLGRV